MATPPKGFLEEAMKNSVTDWQKELELILNNPKKLFDFDLANTEDSTHFEFKPKKSVPTPQCRKILKMGKGAVLHFNPNTTVDQTSKVYETWCIDPEWMHMSNEFSGAKIETDYSITSHTATVVLKIPVEFMQQQTTAEHFMADVYNIMDEAESASDFFAALAIAWSKIENEH